MSELEAAITAAMKAGIKEDGHVAFTRIDCATAVAEVITRTEREIDAKAFFDAVPPSERGAAFYACVKTLVGKAEQLLGAERLKMLAHARHNYSISITAK